MSTQDSSRPKQEPDPTVSAAVAAAQRALLDKLVACEQRFADVYAAYAKSFPATSDFWSALSREEAEHAAMVGSMKRFLDLGHYFLRIGTLVKGLDFTLKELDHEISMAQRRLVTEPQAFNHAIAFESRLVDGHFYDIVECGAAEFQHMAKVLRKGVETHRSRIRDRMVARRAEIGDGWKG